MVAVVDHDPELAGLPVARFVPDAPPHLVVRASLDEVDEWQRVQCALVTTSSNLADCVETFGGLLDRGVDVVSSCEELLYPWLRRPVIAQELHERGVRGNARIVGTGINPGFLMDTILDKNCRIGSDVTISNAAGVENQGEEEDLQIRDGISVVIKNGTIPDGFSC